MDGKTPTKQKSIFKKYLLYVLIGGIAVTALIAISAIIIGEWSDAIGKAILLTTSSWIHCLIALAVISFLPNDSKKNNYQSIFIYTVFGITIASFLTTVLNIFEVIPKYVDISCPSCYYAAPIRYTFITRNLYFWYFGVVLASLIITVILSRSAKKDQNTQTLAYTSAASIVLLMIMFFPPIFSFYIELPDIYFRLILVVAIIASTAAILSVVFGHLYRVQHPELAPKAVAPATIGDGAVDGAIEEVVSVPEKKRLPTWAIVLIVLGVIFVVLPTIGVLLVISSIVSF